ncbi:DUF4184 family protein [Nonomuraea sp. KC401]|uniref:DUF4184 family protein n=1 Tax=unclassified Nonomuraea TaxID=2593643 RepID=UPI0010FD57E5|nr:MULTISPECIES: DUF4184 family protein [unclassified Nonomuraea]NBE99871.1 DUF4184 family protein [Nonomuraea sp. K271]TLF50383.1 DUF4184 family protein [Nonomuraea sp. KC401]
MPFTPSHIAAVVPLMASSRMRRFADPWALALGAMAPDLPLFLPFLPDYTDWHSWTGVVTLDLAAVLVLLPLFHVLFRDPLVSLLPAALAGRAARLAPERLRILPMAAGAVIGAASHVLCDSFTHSTGSVEWGGWLHVVVLGELPLFRLLQYVSSAIGLAAVVWWCRRGLSRMPAAPVPGRLRISRRVRWSVLAACASGTVAGALLWPLVDEPSPELGLPSVLTKAGAGTLVGLCLVLTCYAVVWQVRRRMAVSEGA